MKPSFFMPILIVLIAACSGIEQSQSTRYPINISKALIPSTGQVNLNIAIALQAEAPSGCWNDLKINLNKVDDHHFLFIATGQYTTKGACPEVMIYQDTIINFKVATAGKYYFQINESPYPVTGDTLEVK